MYLEVLSLKKGVNEIAIWRLSVGVTYSIVRMYRHRAHLKAVRTYGGVPDVRTLWSSR